MKAIVLYGISIFVLIIQSLTYMSNLSVEILNGLQIIFPLILLVVGILFVVLSKEKLCTVGLNGTRVLQSLLWGVLLAICLLIGMVIYFRFIENVSVGVIAPAISSLGIFFIGAFQEEIVFRGYILNKWINGLSASAVDKSDSFWSANMYTSIFFVLIHFPIWLRTGQMVFPNVIGSMANIFLLSLLFGYLYKKTNSLWTVIIIHASYNLFVVMFS